MSFYKAYKPETKVENLNYILSQIQPIIPKTEREVKEELEYLISQLDNHVENQKKWRFMLYVADNDRTRAKAAKKLQKAKTILKNTGYLCDVFSCRLYRIHYPLLSDDDMITSLCKFKMVESQEAAKLVVKAASFM